MYYYYYIIQKYVIGCSATVKIDVINANISSQSHKSPIQSSETRVSSLRRMLLGMCRFMIAI